MDHKGCCVNSEITDPVAIEYKKREDVNLLIVPFARLRVVRLRVRFYSLIRSPVFLVVTAVVAAATTTAVVAAATTTASIFASLSCYSCQTLDVIEDSRLS